MSCLLPPDLMTAAMRSFSVRILALNAPTSAFVSTGP